MSLSAASRVVDPAPPSDPAAMPHLVLQVPVGSSLDPVLLAQLVEQLRARRLQPLQPEQPRLDAAPGTRAARLCDLGVDEQTARALLAPLAQAHGFDWALLAPGLRLRDFRLLVLDMDSTLVNVETIDELGSATGLKARIAEITEAAMRGEIADYAESLRRRLALLAGTPESVLEQVWQRMRLNPGAEQLIDTAKSAGLQVILATGGFTWFAERLQRRLGLHGVCANELDIADGRLTGRAREPIVDGAAKRRALLDACERLGCEPRRAIAIGDGANDLPMLDAAGLGVAYHGKPAVQQAADVSLNHCGLDGVLRLFEDQ